MVSEVVAELKRVERVYRMGEVLVPALDGVDLRIERSEYLAIMGRSGSGQVHPAQRHGLPRSTDCRYVQADGP